MPADRNPHSHPSGNAPPEALTSRDRAIIARAAEIIIPTGGDAFDEGAPDMREELLQKADYTIYRFPPLNRFGFKVILFLFEFLPFFVIWRPARFTRLNDPDAYNYMEKLEKGRFPLSYLMTVMKIQVLLSFYALESAKNAIGYSSGSFPDFKGLKY